MIKVYHKSTSLGPEIADTRKTANINTIDIIYFLKIIYKSIHRYYYTWLCQTDVCVHNIHCICSTM